VGIFSALFSSKPKQPAPAVAETVAKAKAARPLEPQRVVATSGIPVAKTNGLPPMPKPVASAAALQMPQPVLPRSITQRLLARPALPGPQSNGSISQAEPNGSLGEITLLLGDVWPHIPVSVLNQDAAVDPNRVLCFPMTQLTAEMARGRPVVSLASVARQCPELFRDPGSIDATEMVRLPLQKLLEQIGKLKRIDFTNPPRALPVASSIESHPRPAVVAEVAPNTAKSESGPLPTWLQSKGQELAGADLVVPPSRPLVTLNTTDEAVLQPFHPAPADAAETFAADIIEIVPAKVDSAGATFNEAKTEPEIEVFLPVAGARIEDYDVPAFGEAPVVEVVPSGDAILDVVEPWPIEAFEQAIVALPTESGEKVETPQAEPKALPVDPDLTPRPAMPSLKTALTESLEIDKPTVRKKIEPGPFVVIGPFIPRDSVPSAGTFAFERVEMPVRLAAKDAVETPFERKELRHPTNEVVANKVGIADESAAPEVVEAVVAPSLTPVAETHEPVEVPEAVAPSAPSVFAFERVEMPAPPIDINGAETLSEPTELRLLSTNGVIEDKAIAASEPAVSEVVEAVVAPSPAPVAEANEPAEVSEVFAPPTPALFAFERAEMPLRPSAAEVLLERTELRLLPRNEVVEDKATAVSEVAAPEVVEAAAAPSPAHVVEAHEVAEVSGAIAPPAPAISVPDAPPAAPVSPVLRRAKAPVPASPSTPSDFTPPRAPNPVIPKFPFRAPRSLTKSPRAAEPTERPKPTPPKSPLWSFLPPKKDEVTPKPSDPSTPRLFGANPLDRYFSTKALPAVNWYAAGALLGLTGEVTPSRIGDAIVNLPGISACMLAAPPALTVSDEWPESLGVDNSLAFGRRLAGVLKPKDSSIVTHRQIVTDVGTILVFAIDDLVLCVLGKGSEVTVATRQRLLVAAKAMAHARQAVRKGGESES
jgi:hypothetical protein